LQNLRNVSENKEWDQKYIPSDKPGSIFTRNGFVIAIDARIITIVLSVIVEHLQRIFVVHLAGKSNAECGWMAASITSLALV
jgi:hypothetical protein